MRDEERLELHRAADAAKDQSMCSPSWIDRLERSIFLGDVASKDEVRRGRCPRAEHLRQAGFLRHLFRRRWGYPRLSCGAARSKPGEIIDVDGNVLGAHEGSYGYTVGQRKGLGIERPAEDGKPRYVLATEPETNRVIVGPAALLSVDELTANEVVWLADDVDPAEEEDLGVQIRAHGREIPARVTLVDGEIVLCSPNPSAE